VEHGSMGIQDLVVPGGGEAWHQVCNNARARSRWIPPRGMPACLTCGSGPRILPLGKHLKYDSRAPCPQCFGQGRKPAPGGSRRPRLELPGDAV
jgi:hypothetical protein